MEKAIHITNLKGLKYLQKGTYQRVYWGIEFCQKLIPLLKNTEKVLQYARSENLSFSFVTPFVTERYIKKIVEIFQWFKKNNVRCEIVVNDWGVLERLNSKFKSFFTLALGRLLVRQQRDPAIGRIVCRQSPVSFKDNNGKLSVLVHELPSDRYQKGARSSYVNSLIPQRFLSEYSVTRLELNNLAQGLNLGGIILKKSLYSPFVNVSTTRFCPMETAFQKMYRIGVCNKECQNYYDELRNKGIPKVLYKKGNTLFYKNPILLKKAREYGVDRVVYQLI